MLKIIITLVLFFVGFAAQAYDAQDFADWLLEFKLEAKSQHISAKTIKNTFKKAKYLPQVIVLDRGQPEFVSPFLSYMSNRVTPSKIALGRAMLQQHNVLLTQVEMQYGVPKQILVAFWGRRTRAAPDASLENHRRARAIEPC